MNFEFFIAKRLFSKKNHTGDKSSPAVTISTIGIAVGLAVMLVAVSVVVGFRGEIRNKLIGIGSHVQITSYYSNFTYDMEPVNISDSLIDGIKQVPSVKHVQLMFTKPGIIKTNGAFQAIVLKGFDAGYDTSFISSCMKEGRMPDISSGRYETALSSSTADLLRLSVGDKFLCYFVKGENVTVRKFTVTGIFQTNFSDFDNNFAYAPAGCIRRINGWKNNQAGGIELLFDNMKNFESKEDSLYAFLYHYSVSHNYKMYMQDVFDLNSSLFGWLDLLDTNVLLILILMVFVSGFNIISGLLILILDKTNFIGIMKALGSSNKNMKKIFRYFSLFIIGRGLLWGNIIGLGICLIQHFFKVLSLNPSVYYVSYVPMDINIINILLVNAGVVAISLLVVFIPLKLISSISPVKALKFD